ncbi:MAG: TaqI-like C-terminal specificity domain-containing protein [Oscillospiraceae bacterium]
MENRFDNSASWVILSPIEQSIKRKIEAVGTPLKDWNVKIYRGILTGYNDAFIVNGTKKDELIAADPKSAEIIRPILRGRDIKRYGYDFADLWLINTHNGIKEQGIPPVDVNKYPAIKAHLDQYYDVISKRYDKGDTPYNLRNCIYTDDFSRQKIVWKRVGSILRFGYDNLGHYSLDSTCFLTGSHLKFLTLLLNSPMGKFLLKDSPRTGTGDLLVSVQAVEPILIPQISSEDETIFDDYFDKINNSTNHNEDIKDIELRKR